jgi:hypothetical protein
MFVLPVSCRDGFMLTHDGANCRAFFGPGIRSFFDILRLDSLLPKKAAERSGSGAQLNEKALKFLRNLLHLMV